MYSLVLAIAVAGSISEKIPNMDRALTLTANFKAETLYKEYKLAKFALEHAKDYVRRAEAANRMVQRVVSPQEINNWKLRVHYLEAVILHKKHLWLQAIGLAIPENKTYIKTSLGIMDFIDLKYKFPNGAISTTVNGDMIFLLSPRAWRYYMLEMFKPKE